jgi:hypothetical protein
MTDETKAWQTYEEVTQYLLNRFADKFGIDRVEGKQIIRGHKSGTNWEIDAKGVGFADDLFLLVECRRYTSSRQSQEQVGALAYRIQDTGASSGIIVSPLGLQGGAAKIARAEKIHSVILDPECTTKQYVLKFLENVHYGEEVGTKARVRVGAVDKAAFRELNRPLNG